VTTALGPLLAFLLGLSVSALRARRGCGGWADDGDAEGLADHRAEGPGDEPLQEPDQVGALDGDG